MAPPLKINGHSIVVVTGASRGIGREIVLQHAKRSGVPGVYCLFARTSDALHATEQLLKQSNSETRVYCYVQDLADNALLHRNFDDFLQHLAGEHFENCLIFHNAGTVGQLAPTIKLDDVNEWRAYFDTNFLSALALNALCWNGLSQLAEHRYVINITSLIGRKPFVHMAMYGCAKAVRDAYFKTFALEEGAAVAVLNYSPGPVDTNMFDQILIDMKDEIQKNTFEQTKKNILTTEQTIDKMMKLLIDGAYESGDIIDYYDLS